ncbi:MAG: LysM peptidoglycan-binding domain-containing protein [Clostridia bacterium]|nr:LysM peptidoglycan-binding domain-containing protein [Clostridia bacterium]
MEENVNLSLDELEKAGGGIGGSPDPLPVHPGYICYQIRPGDNLTNLAKTYKTSIEDLYTVNKKYISTRSDITKGFYMYVPDIGL